MNYQLLYKEIDLANKHRVRLVINDVNVMFKYDVDPTDEMIQESVDSYLMNMTPIETEITGSL